MSARESLSPEQRAAISAQLGDAKAARNSLLESFSTSIRDRAQHDHALQREDWFCLNLSAYMGERMAVVLRRLLDAESDAARYRTAWRRARTRALATGAAADRYAARARGLQTALQDSLVAIVGKQIDGPGPEIGLTVYRAEHESIVFGLYLTRDAAREHCETYVRREQPGAVLNWIADEDDELSPQELVAQVGDEEDTTGYVVTPLTVAAAYDPDGDE